MTSPPTPPVWVPDSERSACSSCGVSFTVFRGKHHCRICGDIFCAKCSKGRVESPSKKKTSVRVCDGCLSKRKSATLSPKSPARNLTKDFEATVHKVTEDDLTNNNVSTQGVKSSKKQSAYDVQGSFRMLETWCNDEDGWKFTSNSKGLKRYAARTNEDGFAGARGEVIIDAPPRVVFNFFKDLDCRCEYDELFEGYADFQEIDKSTYVTQIKTAAKFPASGRDFCVLRHNRKQGPAKYAMFQTSVTHEKCPPGLIRKYVRGQLRSFAIVQGVGDDVRRTRLTVAMSVNLNGNLPTWLIRYVITQQLDALLIQKKYVESRNLDDAIEEDEEGDDDDESQTRSDECVAAAKEPSFRIQSTDVVQWWTGERRSATILATDRMRVKFTNRAEMLEIRMRLVESGVEARGSVSIASLLSKSSNSVANVSLKVLDGQTVDARVKVLLETAPHESTKQRHSFKSWSAIFAPSLLSLVAFVLLKKWLRRHVSLGASFVALLFAAIAAVYVARKRRLSSRCNSERSMDVRFISVGFTKEKNVQVASKTETGPKIVHSKAERDVAAADDSKVTTMGFDESASLTKSEAVSDGAKKNAAVDNSKTTTMDFDEAAALAKKLSNLERADMLELYGLYKTATKGACRGSRPGVFDVVGRAKFDAWKKASASGRSASECKDAYASLVARLWDNRTGA